MEEEKEEENRARTLYIKDNHRTKLYNYYRYEES